MPLSASSVWAVPIVGVLVATPAALLAAVLLPAITANAVNGGGCSGDGGPGGGSQQIVGNTFSAEQLNNAQTITAVVVSRQLPQRAAVIAVTAALVESDLRNLPAGDRDSLGLFQERPSQGWGSPEDILNPAYATAQFLNHLVTIPNWAALPPGVAEQDVERSAFPDRYAGQEPAATTLVSRFWTGPNTAPQTATDGCPDQGASNLTASATTLPPTYQLPADPVEAAAVSFAISQVGKPYVWGAKGPNAFDCSGLVQAAWAHAGVPISAGTTSQVHDGTAVTSLADAQPGDLLFIPGSLGTPTNPRHVGMDIGNGLVVDAYDTQRGVIIEQLAAWAPKIVDIRHIAGGTQWVAP